MAEKLPTDVLAHVFMQLITCNGHPCVVCRRPLSEEVRNADMQSAMMVNRKWRAAWKRMILRSMSINPFPFCPNPVQCFLRWHQNVRRYQQSLPKTSPYQLLK